MSQYDNFFKEYVKLRKGMLNSHERSEITFFSNLLGSIKGKKLLDLGCGFGDYAKFYAKKGAKVTGLDNSKKEIEYARSQNIKNTDFLVFDLLKKLPFKNNEFDIITSSLVLDHIENLRPLFEECFRVLKPKKEMLFSIANPIFYQEKSLAGKFKFLGRKFVFGNYFKRRKIKRIWGGKVTAETYHKLLEDYFAAFLNSGFELVEFREPKLGLNKLNWHSRNPTVLVFRIRKRS